MTSCLAGKTHFPEAHLADNSRKYNLFVMEKVKHFVLAKTNVFLFYSRVRNTEVVNMTTRKLTLVNLDYHNVLYSNDKCIKNIGEL